MNLRNVFFNDHGRLRSGLRFMIYLISVFIATAVVLGVVFTVLGSLPVALTAGSVIGYLLQSALSLAIALFFGWLFGKLFEDLPFRALGCWFTRNWFRDLSAGLLFGVFSIGLAATIAVAGGGLNFRFNDAAGGAAILGTLAASLAVFTVAAAFEEVFFRGYLLQTLARARLAWVAIFLTSAFFAVAHLGNNNANLVSTLNTALAGVWLGVAYLKTRNLWFPFGIHLTWNWFQGAIFGVEVSGITQFTTAPVLREIDRGPAWLTGAGYGLEGGIPCTIALVATIALIYFVPFLKPDAEMLALTDAEQTREPAINSRESRVGSRESGI